MKNITKLLTALLKLFNKSYTKYIIVLFSIMLIFSNIRGICRYANNSLTVKSTQYKQDNTITEQEWFYFLEHAYAYIKKHKNQIKPEKNISGFYRIYIPTPEYLAKKKGVDKIRLNYWPTDHSNSIKTENVHNHPNHFESFIIKGGYKHSIYNELSAVNSLDINTPIEKYYRCQIIKSQNRKREGICKGSAILVHSRDQYLKEGMILIMPIDVLHKVQFTLPGSLSMNVTIKKQNNRNYYDVMVPKNDNIESINPSREIQSTELTNKIIYEVEDIILHKIFMMYSKFTHKDI